MRPFRFPRSRPAAVLRRAPMGWISGVALGVLSILLAPVPGQAQIISPGKLSAAHQDLEGVRGCTQCHRLRQKGIDRSLCLECHTPLAERLGRDTGFHATLPQDDCAACHKEHFGRDFDVLRLDTLKFEHERTGYPLTGLHVDAGCRSCHVPDFITDPGVRSFKVEHAALARTFLGLGTSCARCHEEANPHRGQFEERRCDDCHDTGGWEETPGFDHQESRYPLTGAHRRVSCVGCHAPLPGSELDRPPDDTAGRAGSGALRFTPVSFSACTSCHDDPHGGTMQGRCESCHDTGAWASVNRGRLERTFDHRSTGFELEGRHAALECAACHDAAVAGGLPGISLTYRSGASRRTYPPPRADGCMSCHLDTHEGDFAERRDGGDCRSCHDQERWLPADYDLARHNDESSYRLEGAHLVIPCAGCHRTPDGMLRIRLGAPECADCHTTTRDPHRDQFQGRDCLECHRVEDFSIPDFDHDRTRYPLEGAHLEVSCAGCHFSETGPEGVSFVRYRPLGTECTDCHEGAP